MVYERVLYYGYNNPYLFGYTFLYKLFNLYNALNRTFIKYYYTEGKLPYLFLIKMNLNDLTNEEKGEMEKFISNNLEINLNNKDYDIAELNLEFYTEHIKQYGSQNLQRYCNLKNRFYNLNWKQ